MPAQTPNAKEIPVNVVGSSTFGRFPKISIEKTYNMFESDGWLISTSGYKLAKIIVPTETGVRGRGVYNSIRGGFMIVVINAGVFRVDTFLTPTLIGTIATQAGPVFMDENLAGQICIVDGVSAYIYNYLEGGPNLSKITGGLFASGALVPNYVTFHNTYFLFGNKPTLNNGTNSFWYAYQYGGTFNTISLVPAPKLALETKPDYALAIKRIPGESANVMVFGTACCEVWTNVPTLDIYRKNTSRSIDYGCVSVDTIAANDQYLAWLAVNETNAPVIMTYTNQTFEAISSDGIAYQMNTIKHPAQSTATFLKEDGHVFYQLTFWNPEDNLSLRYDFNTKKFFHVSDEKLNYFPSADIVYFNGNNYFISLNDGSLYEMSTDIFNYDYNDPADLADTNFVDWRLLHSIPRIRVCGTIRSPRTSRYRANLLTLTIEQGVDNGPAFDESLIILIDEFGNRLIAETDNVQLVPEDSGLIQNIQFPNNNQPRVDLSLSYDGGETWSNDDSRYCNPVGYRKNIMQWNQLGEANELTPKFHFWSLGRVVVKDAVVDAY